MPSDDDLLNGIRRGDFDAFDAFYKRYFPRIFLYLFLLGSPPELASAQTDGLLNDILGRVYPKRGTKRVRVAEWLFREVRRRVATRQRQPLIDGGHIGKNLQLNTAELDLITELRGLPKMWYEAFFFVCLQHLSAAEAARVMAVTEDEIAEWVACSITDLGSPQQSIGD